MHERGGGLKQFYGGFEAHLAGRLSYLVIRNSIYKIIYDSVKPTKPFNDLTNREKMVIAGFSGGVAAWFTSPLALINIRQILDSQTRPEWRRNYSGVSGGLAALGDNKYKGGWVNVLRHVVLNVSLTAPFDYFHEALYLRFGDYGFVWPLAVALSNFVSAVVTLPFDNIRTRVMNAHSDPSRNRMNYKGIFDIVVKSYRYEKSHFAMWAGFYTYYFSSLAYAFLTVGITSGITDSIKRAKGINEWLI